VAAVKIRGISMQVILAIAAGDALGAVLRHSMNSSLMRMFGRSFPLGIMSINISGSLALGLLAGLFAHLGDPSPAIKAFLVVGLLGGFTTFSAFSLDTVLLIERGSYMAAGLYVLCSVALSIAGLAAGLYLARLVAL